MTIKDTIKRIRASIKHYAINTPITREQGRVFDTIDELFEKNKMEFIDLVREEKK